MKLQFKRISQSRPESASCQDVRGLPNAVPKDMGFKTKKRGLWQKTPDPWIQLRIKVIITNLMQFSSFLYFGIKTFFCLLGYVLRESSPVPFILTLPSFSSLLKTHGLASHPGFLAECLGGTRKTCFQYDTCLCLKIRQDLVLSNLHLLFHVCWGHSGSSKDEHY